MPEIEGIIFDLGRVLVGIDSTRGLPGWICANTGLDLATLVADRIFTDYNEGRITPRQFWQKGCEKVGCDFEYDQFCQLWCDIFYPMPLMEGLVKDLATRFSLALLSDTDALHWPHIKKSYPWIAQTFTKPALSYEIGAIKPSPVCFEAAVARTGVPKEKCLFIDDLEKNITGARECGLQAIQFTTPQQLQAELTNLGILPA